MYSLTLKNTLRLVYRILLLSHPGFVADFLRVHQTLLATKGFPSTSKKLLTFERGEGWKINKLLRGLEISKVPFIVIVMPECFYRASSKNTGFPLNSIAGMTPP
ncbi:MAG: hypothetical protein HY885_11030 [Deltaproteobacteria bacterium]|nr:hypothetical protein [Deltaproteobacteria bacterium]